MTLATNFVKIAGFIELGSLMLVAGWAFPSCNMPACHPLVTGSIFTNRCPGRTTCWDESGATCRNLSGFMPSPI